MLMGLADLPRPIGQVLEVANYRHVFRGIVCSLAAHRVPIKRVHSLRPVPLAMCKIEVLE